MCPLVLKSNLTVSTFFGFEKAKPERIHFSKVLDYSLSNFRCGRSAVSLWNTEKARLARAAGGVENRLGAVLVKTWSLWQPLDVIALDDVIVFDRWPTSIFGWCLARVHCGTGCLPAVRGAQSQSSVMPPNWSYSIWECLGEIHQDSTIFFEIQKKTTQLSGRCIYYEKSTYLMIESGFLDTQNGKPLDYPTWDALSSQFWQAGQWIGVGWICG